MEAKDTKIIIGLTIEEVEERKRKNLVNYDTSVPVSYTHLTLPTNSRV